MFDDRIVIESPGKLPGMVRPSNIRNTHFSRNPKIAAFLKTCRYVKEYGEGVDRMCRELEVNGVAPLSFYNDDFILKVSVLRLQENSKNDISNSEKLGEKLGENRTAILEALKKESNLSIRDLALRIGISETALEKNMTWLRSHGYILRVGPRKGGYWEVLKR